MSDDRYYDYYPTPADPEPTDWEEAGVRPGVRLGVRPARKLTKKQIAAGVELRAQRISDLTDLTAKATATSYHFTSPNFWLNTRELPLSALTELMLKVAVLQVKKDAVRAEIRLDQPPYQTPLTPAQRVRQLEENSFGQQIRALIMPWGA